MIRFAALGSGSRGNAMVVATGRTTVLIDCGFGPSELVRRLGAAGLRAQDIDAILVTHEHSDHIGGAAAFALHHGIPVYMTHGTRVAGLRDKPTAGELDIHIIEGAHAFAIGDFEVRPFPVPHDAREPVQFTLGNGHRRFGMLTDIGMATPHAIEMLATCEAIVLECNHDARMLADGRYPPALKRRIAGRYGHLENGEAAAILSRLDRHRLQHVLAAHLSEHNNTPALAAAALARALECDSRWIGIAAQDTVGEWRSIV